VESREWRVESGGWLRGGWGEGHRRGWMAAEEGEYVEGMRLAERWGAEKGNHELHEWARMGTNGRLRLFLDRISGWMGWTELGGGHTKALRHGGVGGVERRTLNAEL
jgi:hypothetical protein